MKVGLILITISIFYIGYSDSILNLVIGACIYGIGTGIFSPAVNAWTIDLSLPQYRGKAMATMYIALEVGIGAGALFAGYIFHDQITRIPYIMYGDAIVVFMAFLYVLYWDKKRKTSINNR